ncbi:MAG: hypothetical protein ABF586_13105 [Sporolactobacillus sp.]
MDKNKGERKMPAAMRKKPAINDHDAKRISEILQKNNKLLEERIKKLKTKNN